MSQRSLCCAPSQVVKEASKSFKTPAAAEVHAPATLTLPPPPLPVSAHEQVKRYRSEGESLVRRSV